MKRNEIMPFAATWMDLEIVIQSKVSHNFLYMEARKMLQMNYLQSKNAVDIDVENKHVYQRG